MGKPYNADKKMRNAYKILVGKSKGRCNFCK